MSNDRNRVAIVTGASRGIGKATAELLRGQGTIVFGVSRHGDETAWARQCDVGDESSVARLFDEVASGYRRIDVLVNCAAVISQDDPLDLTTEKWEKVLRVNLIGAYLCCKYAIMHMRQRRYGKIINVSSIAGRSFSRTASVAYTCSKYGVIGLTRHLAAAFGRDGITVNCVAPSQTLTETLLSSVAKARLDELASSNPVGRLADSAEVAQVICFLASDASSYINGAVVDVNGGQL